MELDLGGIGKGCALDAAMGAVSGVPAGIVDLGRSIAVWGRPPRGGWRLALDAPDGGDEVRGALTVDAPSFLSTSSQEEPGPPGRSQDGPCGGYGRAVGDCDRHHPPEATRAFLECLGLPARAPPVTPAAVPDGSAELEFEH